MADIIPYSPVTFTAGAPIDVDDLNKLQSNIANVKVNAESQIQTINQTVGGVQKTVNVIPIIFADSEEITIPVSGDITKTISFTNGASFTEIPIMIASFASDVSQDDSVFLRAIAKSQTTGEIQIRAGKQKTTKQVTVNYMVIQLKQV